MLSSPSNPLEAWATQPVDLLDLDDDSFSGLNGWVRSAVSNEDQFDALNNVASVNLQSSDPSTFRMFAHFIALALP
jgi:hypothetical protein